MIRFLARVHRPNAPRPQRANPQRARRNNKRGRAFTRPRSAIDLLRNGRRYFAAVFQADGISSAHAASISLTAAERNPAPSPAPGPLQRPIEEFEHEIVLIGRAVLAQQHAIHDAGRADVKKAGEITTSYWDSLSLLRNSCTRDALSHLPSALSHKCNVIVTLLAWTTSHRCCGDRPTVAALREARNPIAARSTRPTEKPTETGR